MSRPAPGGRPVVGVVCALAAESRPLARTAGGTLVTVSGMGGPAAATAAAALIDAGATALLSWGLAGGLDPALKAGDLFLPDRVTAADGTVYRPDPAWRQQLGTALHAHHPIGPGTLYTSRRAIASVADKAALHRDRAAAAVDMEGHDVAAIAAAHRLPFLALKVIVDGAADALPRAVSAAADRAGRLHLGRLLAALAASPADLAPLWRLARRYRAARRTLTAVARALSASPAGFAAGSPRAADSPPAAVP